MNFKITDWMQIIASLIIGVLITLLTTCYSLVANVARLEGRISYLEKQVSEKMNISDGKHEEKSNGWLSKGDAKKFGELVVILEELIDLNQPCADFVIRFPDEKSESIKCINKGERRNFVYKDTKFVFDLLKINAKEAYIELSETSVSAAK